MLVLCFPIFLVALTPVELGFRLIYAQPNSTDTLIKDNVKSRSVIRSPQNQEFVFSKLIGVATDKQNYDPDKIVNITITNLGTQPIHFSGTSSDIKIRNLKNNETFTPSIVLSDSLIPSGSSKQISWNQQDFNGLQVPLGNYTAEVTIGDLHGNTTFSIS
jgi:hypothetical protein